MQIPGILTSILLASSVLGGHAEQTRLSPVTRVVELLKGLSLKIDDESSQEEKLYNAFVCWGKGIMSDKKASNAAAASRVQMLNTYIADLDAGRIELTSERVDLEKELEAIHADMEVATDIRKKENADFQMAEEEMNKAINALTDAIEVLRTATEGHESGVFLRMRGKNQQRAGASSAQAAAMTRAVEMGKKFLTKGDAVFLQRLLTGEVPTVDWKKLNRKADFKMSYKARSFKIQEVLAQLLETFSSNLEDARAKESSAQGTYDKLMDSKGAQKTAAQEALTKMETENGAKGLSRTDASNEVEMLDTQMADDVKYIGELEAAVAKKKEEWKARSSLRAEEQAAISKAIAILHGDDSRDLFKKSFASQGYNFLQESSGAAIRRASEASRHLLEAGQAVQDNRLLALAARVRSSAGRFDAVLEAIDKMLARLKTEEQDDLTKKETCEKERKEDTRSAIVASRTIDEATELMDRLTSEINNLAEEIQENTDKRTQIKKTMDDLTRVRKEEQKAYLAAKKDDEDAAQLVTDATTVLQEFYSSNGLMLTQEQKQPGQAPIAPPATWDGEYGGKTQEATGIISILTMIKEDIQKDIAKGESDEQESDRIYSDTMDKLGKEVDRLTTLIDELDESKGKKEGERTETKESRGLKKGELDIVMKKIKDAEPGCNYFTIKYPLRLKDRQIEIDGLLKAKAILSGGNFAKPEDPNREIRPGDALVDISQHF